LAAKRIEVAKLNAHLQDVFLNNSLNEKIMYKYENIEFGFRHNDRIMYLENDYEQDMFNGDMMRVVDLEFNARKLLVVSTNSPNSNPNQVKLEDVQPAYALTTHKAQGSEFKYVIIYIGQGAELLHNDQWLYTAFTRGKQQVIVFGYREEIEQTIKREMPARRTFLRHRMQLQFSKRLKDLLRNELQNVPM
jgi:exodeoxyribonuclease V alpha subunit